MIAAGSGLLVVASGGAGAVAAVAHVWRWRVVVIVVGVLGLISSLTVTWVVAVGQPLAIVRVRHASCTVLLDTVEPCRAYPRGIPTGYVAIVRAIKRLIE